MAVTFDPETRQWTLANKGLDFLDAEKVFAGITITQEDDREDYGETRFQTYGLLNRRVVMIVWTWRGQARRIISMRVCNGREGKEARARLRSR